MCGAVLLGIIEGVKRIRKEGEFQALKTGSSDLTQQRKEIKFYLHVLYVVLVVLVISALGSSEMTKTTQGTKTT